MEQDTVNNTYNYESFVTLPDNVSAAEDEMKNFTFTGTTGWYKIEADYLTSTLIIAEHTVGAETYTYDYANLYIVGDYGADGVWDADNAVAFTKLSEGLFTIEKQIKECIPGHRKKECQPRKHIPVHRSIDAHKDKQER